MAEVVKLEHVKKYYHTPQGETEALKDIHFSVGENEVVAKIADKEFVVFVGPSGCGNSTVLSLIAGLEKPSGGRVLLDGVDAHAARGRIGYMLQQDQLFPWLTIRQNVLLGPDIRHVRTKETEDKADALLEQYGLGAFKNAHPAHLSGGMRQRAALIRTLALDPALLLLDEPFSALDYQTRLAVADDIRAIIKRQKKTAILVTHDIAEAISMSDRVIVLSARPSCVVSQHKITLDGQTPLEKRSAPGFSAYFQELWKELNAHGQQGAS